MNNNLKKKMSFSLLFKMGVVLIVILYAVYLWMECIYGLPSFDGAMNLQVPKVFLNSGEYKTTYDGGILFDGKIQTRIPVLLPICVLWKIFGVHYELAVLVNILYLLLLLYAVFRICKELAIDQKAIVCLLVFMLSTPYLDEFAFGIYGEIPTMALLLLSILMMVESEKITDDRIKMYKVIWSGVFYSFACLNKTVIFIALPSFLFIFFIKTIRDKIIPFKVFFVWLVAYIIPFCVEELFHFFQMGMGAYIDGWKKELLDIVQQAGVSDKYEDTANILDKFWKHIGIFCSNFHFKFGSVAFCLMLLMVFLSWMYYFFIKKEHGFENIILLVMCSYFGWWILISTTAMAWPRRIIIGVLLLEMIICEYVNKLFLKIHIKMVWNLLFVVFVVVFTVRIFGEINRFDKESKKQVIELANTIKELNNSSEATFYGFGWWQAPVLSFFSGVDFYDFYRVEKIPENAYLLIDEYSVHLAESEIESIRNEYALEFVKKSGDNYLYKILSWEENNFAFVSAFSDEDYTGIRQSVFESAEDYSYVRGIHEYEEANRSRWVTPNVEILLQKEEGHNRLEMEVSIPAVENMSNTEPLLYIIVDGKLIWTDTISEQGNKTVSVDLTDLNLSNGVKDVRIYFNARLLSTNGDNRKLAYQLKSIGFYE